MGPEARLITSLFKVCWCCGDKHNALLIRHDKEGDVTEVLCRTCAELNDYETVDLLNVVQYKLR